MKVVRWKSVDRDYRMSFLLNMSSHFGSLMCDAYFHCFAAGSDNENKPLQPLSYTSWQQGEPDQACCVCVRVCVHACVVIKSPFKTLLY